MLTFINVRKLQNVRMLETSEMSQSKHYLLKGSFHHKANKDTEHVLTAKRVVKANHVQP